MIRMSAMGLNLSHLIDDGCHTYIAIFWKQSAQPPQALLNWFLETICTMSFHKMLIDR
jgi:hypothetical protein